MHTDTHTHTLTHAHTHTAILPHIPHFIFNMFIYRLDVSARLYVGEYNLYNEGKRISLQSHMHMKVNRKYYIRNTTR